MRFLEFDTLTEILTTMRENKLRTFLTGFAVAWGIFMLIILMGSGNGLKNGITANFNDRATNTMMVWSGRTALPYKGFKAYRKVNLTNDEITMLKNRFKEIGAISGEIDRNSTVSFTTESGSFNVSGVQPGYGLINNMKIKEGDGRFINDYDINQARKVIVLSKKVADVLFKNKKALGKWVKVDGLFFQVIGIDTNNTMNNEGKCYIPINTAQKLYQTGNKIYNISFTILGFTTKEEIDAFGQKIRETLGRQLIIHPDDLNTIGLWNQAADYEQTMKIFSTIDLFILFIGICTLIAGIVGVGNIMVITVKERTKEFGIRKALGATPGTILRSILLESIVITSLFGLLGIILGVGLLELIGKAMGVGNESSEGQTMQLFKNPSVNLTLVLGATGLLVLSGLFAGYIPARKAVRIKPIEAMHAE
jgi:putative ABC transport system permease protein